MFLSFSRASIGALSWVLLTRFAVSRSLNLIISKSLALAPYGIIPDDNPSFVVISSDAVLSCIKFLHIRWKSTTLIPTAETNNRNQQSLVGHFCSRFNILCLCLLLSSINGRNSYTNVNIFGLFMYLNPVFPYSSSYLLIYCCSSILVSPTVDAKYAIPLALHAYAIASMVTEWITAFITTHCPILLTGYLANNTSWRTSVGKNLLFCFIINVDSTPRRFFVSTIAITLPNHESPPTHPVPSVGKLAFSTCLRTSDTCVVIGIFPSLLEFLKCEFVP